MSAARCSLTHGVRSAVRSRGRSSTERAIAAGLPTFEIAATMGTSLEQLPKTYAP